MTSVRDLLRDADPVRHEPQPVDGRDRVRRAVVAAAGDPQRQRLRGRTAVVSVIVAIALVAAAGSRLWTGSATVQAAAVRFEARLAESTATLDLIPVRVPGSNEMIYLHRDAVVTNDDVAAARVVPGKTPTEFAVAIVFTPAGAQKMRAATSAHLGQPLALMIDGQVVIAPTIRSAISNEAMLTGNYTRQDADRIANGMVAR